MLTLDALTDKVQSGEIETVIVGFTDHMGRLMGKRFDAEHFLDHASTEGTHGCDYLLTVDMEMTPVAGYQYANWERGYGDFHLVPDLSTLRTASWLEGTALVFCDIDDPVAHQPVAVAPRTILREQIARASQRGYQPVCASELEYYLFTTPYRDAARQDYTGLNPAGWYIEDYHILQGTRTEKFHAQARRSLKHSGVPVENTKGEWGKGQHELNIHYAEALTMADRHVLMKQCLKELADQLDFSVTFMAKPHSAEAGSSCHIHMSLWADEQNSFSDPQKPDSWTDTFRWFLGGWMAAVPDMMVFYAPTINSYKRFEDGSWAPTRIAWSQDNRTAGFRVVGQGSSLRIECRLPGADCNPYLAFAAALASGLNGIDNQIEPPDEFTGNVYDARHLPHVPYTLNDATDRFENSEVAKQAFGAAVVEHYSHFFRMEIEDFHRAVTDWERRRYFERI
jgi:glutamine synthetase